MIFGPFLDVLPKAGLAGAILWAGANYFVVAPNLAARVTLADFVPACERNHETMALAAAKERTAELPPPSIDPVKQMAARSLRQMMNNPVMQALEQMGGELGGVFPMREMADIAIAQQEQAAKAAKEAYDRSLERLKRETASRIGSAGTTCSCLAAAAVEDTRTEWAIWTGTLTLFRPAPLQNFDQRMAEAYTSGRCTGLAKVSP